MATLEELQNLFQTNPQIEYDITGAVKAGLSESDIAKFASDRRGYDYQGARKAGLSDADIIRHNIAGVSDAGALGAFAEETAESLAVAPLAALGGTAGFAAATALGAPVALGVLGALVLGGAATAAGTFAVDEIKEALDIGGGQYVPSARPGAVAGETTGFIVGFGLPTIARGLLNKVATTSLGTKLGLTPKTAGPVNLGSAEILATSADNGRMRNALGKTLEALEQGLQSSRATRLAQPKTSLVTDVGIAVGAGLGAGAAEATAPDNFLLRVAGEIAGGTFNTANLLNIIGRRVGDIFKRGKLQLAGKDEAAQEAARKAINDLISGYGEDQAKAGVARATINSQVKKFKDDLNRETPEILRSNQAGKKIVPTLIEKSNDDIARVITAALMNLRGSDEIGSLQNAALQRVRENARNIGTILDSLNDVDDPALMAALSQAVEQNFQALIQDRVNVSVIEALDSANRLKIDDKTETAQRIFNVLNRGYEEVEKIEDDLYKQLNKKTRVPVKNILQFYDRQVNPKKGGIPANKNKYVAYLNSFIKDIQNLPENEGKNSLQMTATLGQMLDFRSRMLAEARVKTPTEAGAPMAGFYSKMAQKAQTDLTNPRFVPETEIEKFNVARAFTKAKNDVYNRAYGGTVLKKKASGELKNPAEELANNIFTRAGNISVKRLDDLDEAISFTIKQVPDPQVKAEMQQLLEYDLRGAEQALLRAAASEKVIDPATGQIRPSALANFTRKYAEVLDRAEFADLARDLQDANKAQLLLTKTLSDTRTAGFTPRQVGQEVLIESATDVPTRRGMLGTQVFGKQADDIDAARRFLVNQESPTQEIIAIRNNSKNPNKEFSALINLVKNNADEVDGDPIRGLKQIIVDAAVQNSRDDATGFIDFDKFDIFLNQPMRTKGSQSLRNVLQESGIASADELDRLQVLAEYGRRGRRFARGEIGDPLQAAEDLLGDVSLLVGFAQRVAGAATFSSLFNRIKNSIPLLRGGSATLQAPSYGAILADKYLNVLPDTAAKRVLLESFMDADQFNTLFNKISTVEDVQEVHGALKPVLESIIGLEGYRQISEYIQSPEFAAREEVAVVTPEPAPTTVAVASPPPAPLVTPTPAPAAPMPPAQGPTNRESYAALFPDDLASDVIRQQQGIGSLV